MAAVTVENAGGVAVLTLATERRNAITPAAAAALEDAIAAAEADPSVSAVIVTGTGPAFCSGADRGLLAAADEESLRAVYRSFLAVRECSLPTVAAVNGPAVGAGLNLALSCDVRIAAESARFDPRFLQLPVHPGGGHLWMLQRLVGPQAAAALVLFDQAVSAHRARELGLVWQVVADGEVVAASRAFCDRLAHAPDPALARTIKETLRAAAETGSHSDALEYELRRQLDSMDKEIYRSRIGASR